VQFPGKKNPAQLKKKKKKKGTGELPVGRSRRGEGGIELA